MKVGFIGAGNMGNPMATNLIKAGHQLVVHDLQRESATNLLEMGATWANTPAETASSGSEIIFTSLPFPRDIEAVVLGEDGALYELQVGSEVDQLDTDDPAAGRSEARLPLDDLDAASHLHYAYRAVEAALAHMEGEAGE